MTDEMTWIFQAQHGDEEAFTHLVETYQKPVYNLCYRMLGDPDGAEDAAQETFLKVYQNLNRYDRDRSFATWLLSIAAHYCIDRLRRRKFVSFSIDEKEEGQTELPDHAAPDPEEETTRKQEREHLQLLLQSLNPTDRAAVILRYWYDASEAEIAQTLKISIPAVKSRLHRARLELAEKWKESKPHHRVGRSPNESPAF